MTEIRPVRFFCNQCGVELFQSMDLNEHFDYTLEELIIRCQCTDCMLKCIRKHNENVEEFSKKLDKIL